MHAGCVNIVAHDLSGVVDTERLGLVGAGEVDCAEDVAVGGEAMLDTAGSLYAPTITPAPLILVAILAVEPGTDRI